MRPRFLAGIVAIMLFFVCAIGIAIGVTIIFVPSPKPLILGWFLALAFLSLAVATVGIWRRILSGIFACGAFNGCLMIISGHPIGQPDKILQRPLVGVLAVTFLLLAILAAKIDRTEKPLDLLSRTAYGAVMLLLSLAFAFEGARVQSLGVLLCTLGALALWNSRSERGSGIRKGREATSKPAQSPS